MTYIPQTPKQCQDAKRQEAHQLLDRLLDADAAWKNRAHEYLAMRYWNQERPFPAAPSLDRQCNAAYSYVDTLAELEAARFALRQRLGL